MEIPMKDWNDLRARLWNARPWIILFAVPLVINTLIAQLIVRPEQGRLRDWSELSRLVEIKPKLESLLTESRQVLLTREKKSGFEASDPAAALNEAERLARQHHVEIDSSQIKGNKAAATSFSLKVTGSFDRLARWISEAEASRGWQIDHWTLTAAKEPNRPHQLMIDLSVLKEGLK